MICSVYGKHRIIFSLPDSNEGQLLETQRQIIPLLLYEKLLSKHNEGSAGLN